MIVWNPHAPGKIRLRQTCLDAVSDHVPRSRTHPLDVSGEIHGLCEERVARYRPMGLPEFFEGQGRWELARVPDLQAVRKEHHLHAAVAGVIAVGDGVYNCFRHRLFRDLVLYRRLRAGLACTHREGDLAEDEIHRRVHEIEDRAFVDLIGWDRFGHLGTVEVGALELGRDQESLRLFAEEEDSRVR